MWRLKLRMRGIYQAFPGAAYPLMGAISLIVVLLTPLTLELGFFVLFPGLSGLIYLVSPREKRQWRPHRIAAAAWLGSSAFGVLAHWDLLEPYTPWFSFVRYVLFAAAYVGSPLLEGYLRPPVSREQEARRRRLSVRISVTVGLLFQFIQVGAVFYLAPYRLALAPRYPGLRMEQVLSFPDKEHVRPLAWSPDSRYLLAPTGADDIWLITPETGDAKRLVADAMSLEQPWLSTGEGFLYKGREEDYQYPLRFASLDGNIVDMGDGGVGTACSPVELRVAYGWEGDLWSGMIDGAEHYPVLARAGRPLWSPDGRHLLVTRWPEDQEGKPTTWVTDIYGSASQVSLEAHIVEGVAVWAGADAIASLTADDSLLSGLEDGFWRPGWLKTQVRLQLIDLHGTVRAELETSVPLGAQIPALTASPDGRMIAFAVPSVIPIPDSPGSVYLIDVEAWKLWRPPTGMLLVSSLAWSPDGTRLAVTGMRLDWAASTREHEWVIENGVWIVSGFADR